MSGRDEQFSAATMAMCGRLAWLMRGLLLGSLTFIACNPRVMWPENRRKTPEECIDAREEPKGPTIARWQVKQREHLVIENRAIFERCSADLKWKGFGHAFVSVLVNRDGSVRSVNISDNTFPCALPRCVVAAIQKLHFEPPPHSHEQSFHQNFSTRPRGNMEQSAPKNPEPVDCPDLDNDRRPSAREIQKTVRAEFPQMVLCYREALAFNPELRGTVATRFDINPDGSVSDVAVAQNAFADCEFTACLKDVYRDLKFPKTSNGKVTVVYPITFEP